MPATDTIVGLADTQAANPAPVKGADQCDCGCPRHHARPRTTFTEPSCDCQISCASQPPTLLIQQPRRAVFLNPQTGSAQCVPRRPDGSWAWPDTGPFEPSTDEDADTADLIERVLQQVNAALRDEPDITGLALAGFDDDGHDDRLQTLRWLPISRGDEVVVRGEPLTALRTLVLHDLPHLRHRLIRLTMQQVLAEADLRLCQHQQRRLRAQRDHWARLVARMAGLVAELDAVADPADLARVTAQFRTVLAQTADPPSSCGHDGEGGPR
jgi:hypothetical protein